MARREGYAESYEKENAHEPASGTLTAPFSGIHGWYWENPRQPGGHRHAVERPASTTCRSRVSSRRAREEQDVPVTNAATNITLDTPQTSRQKPPYATAGSHRVRCPRPPEDCLNFKRRVRIQKLFRCSRRIDRLRFRTDFAFNTRGQSCDADPTFGTCRRVVGTSCLIVRLGAGGGSDWTRCRCSRRGRCQCGREPDGAGTAGADSPIRPGRSVLV